MTCCDVSLPKVVCWQYHELVSYKLLGRIFRLHVDSHDSAVMPSSFYHFPSNESTDVVIIKF